MATGTLEANGAFLKHVIEETPDGARILRCLQCGSCGGSCPSGGDMEYTPRAIISMILDGDRDTVLRANTMWTCVSCYFCTTRCPQRIPITDIMYTLKRQAIREHAHRDTDAPALAKTFTDYVDRYGRSFEFGLATGYMLLNRPLSALKMGPMGLQMFSKGRMSLKPSKIKNIDQLRAIIHKARELGEQK